LLFGFGVLGGVLPLVKKSGVKKALVLLLALLLVG
jgi:hypothetical protein